MQELDKCGQPISIFVAMLLNKPPDTVLDRVEPGVHARARRCARRRSDVRGLKHHPLARELAQVRGWLGVVAVPDDVITMSHRNVQPHVSIKWQATDSRGH